MQARVENVDMLIWNLSYEHQCYRQPYLYYNVNPSSPTIFPNFMISIQILNETIKPVQLPPSILLSIDTTLQPLHPLSTTEIYFTKVVSFKSSAFTTKRYSKKLHLRSLANLVMLLEYQTTSNYIKNVFAQYDKNITFGLLKDSFTHDSLLKYT